MVTVSGEEAKKPSLIPSLLQSGMNCVRINCAHDSPETWLDLVQQLRTAEKDVGRECRILMDLGGPKLRTGPIELGPPVLRWKPERNRLGQVIRPAVVILRPRGMPLPPHFEANANLELPPEFLQDMRPDDELQLKDARGAFRRLRVSARRGAAWLAESHSSAYLTDGTVLHSTRTGKQAELNGLPAAEDPILLRQGDELRLTRSLSPGRGAVRDELDKVLEPAFIGCTLGEAFSELRPGLRVLIDDGKIEGVIRRLDRDSASLEITRVPPKGAKLRGDRGINLPEAHLPLPSLTSKDLEDLSFVIEHAQMVGLSFVQRPEDVLQL
jgi:pyruvate kinase